MFYLFILFVYAINQNIYINILHVSNTLHARKFSKIIRLRAILINKRWRSLNYALFEHRLIDEHQHIKFYKISNRFDVNIKIHFIKNISFKFCKWIIRCALNYSFAKLKCVNSIVNRVNNSRISLNQLLLTLISLSNFDRFFDLRTFLQYKQKC